MWLGLAQTVRGEVGQHLYHTTHFYSHFSIPSMPRCSTCARQDPFALIRSSFHLVSKDLIIYKAPGIRMSEPLHLSTDRNTEAKARGRASPRVRHTGSGCAGIRPWLRADSRCTAPCRPTPPPGGPLSSVIRCLFPASRPEISTPLTTILHSHYWSDIPELKTQDSGYSLLNMDIWS